MTIIFLDGLHGVNYHRLIVPFLRLIEQGHNVHLISDPFEVLDYDLTHVKNYVVSRTIYAKIKGAEVFAKRLKDAGVKIIVDLDDYWKVDHDHPNIKDWKGVNGFSRAIQRTVAIADEVWTPSEYLRDLMKEELNATATYRIIPNAINPDHDQWSKQKDTGKDLWFGYLGAASHQKDTNLIKGLPWENFNTFAVEMQNADYVDTFKVNKKTGPKPIGEYATLYRNTDVSLVPLADNLFNRCKSPVKVAEAAYTGTAIIASNVTPYKEVIKHGETGILCDTEEEWYEAVSTMTKKKAKQLADNLYEDVAHQYHIDTVNQERLKGLEDGIS